MENYKPGRHDPPPAKKSRDVPSTTGTLYRYVALAITSGELAASSNTPTQKNLKLISAAITGFAAGFSTVFGPWASMAGNAVACGMNTLVQEWVDRGFGGIKWGKVGAAMGIGGALGLAFGAIGAAGGANARISVELMGEALEISAADVAGGLAGYACSDAFSNGLYP